MDIDKIYREFEAAQASDNFEVLNDLIFQAKAYGDEFFKAGRTSDIPQKIIDMAKCVNVPIYYMMKYLGDGEFDKAKKYLNVIADRDIESFDEFFHMLYLLGKAFYTTGNFLRALKFFNRYDKERAAKWNDIDELSLFYQANCFALLDKFELAAKLYEQVLSIKADFPEAKRNLRIVRRGSNENLLREISSLWNFPNWRDVPIFINARDRLGVLKKLLDWLRAAGYRKLIILDNLSTYPPLLEFYRSLESDSRIKIVRLEKNFGFKALWLSGILEQMKISTPYVYTDPDILPIENCPKDFVRQLMKILDANREMRKVGLGLVWEDITFFDKDETQRHESDFYSGTKVGENLYYVQLDTTFALYSNVRHYSLRLSLRTGGDLRAYHLPWYFDYDNLPDDEKYYTAHAERYSSTASRLNDER